MLEDPGLDQLVYLKHLHGPHHQGPQFGQVLEGKGQRLVAQERDQRLDDVEGEHLVLDLDLLGFGVAFLLVAETLVDAEGDQIADVVFGLV